MAPARVAPAKAEMPAVEAPAPAPVRTAEGRQMAPVILPEGRQAAPDWEYQEPLDDEQRKALALQQWNAAGQKGTPDDPIKDMMGIKAPSSSFGQGQPSPNAPNFAAAQGITPGAPEWHRASFPQEGGGKYTNRVAPLAPPAAVSQETPTGMPRQALSFGPMQDAPEPAPVASQSQADQVWQRMITQESSNRQFDRSGRPITSRAGALGIAQVMPGTGPEAARLAGLPWSLDRLRNDPEYNHALGRAYYDEQLRQFGNPVLAAAAYNGGPGRVTKALQLAERTNRPFTDFLKPETRDYVRIVASPSSRRPPLRFGTPEGYADGGRTGYANEGAVDDGAVYDPMGNVAVPAATTDPNAKEGLYDTAMKKVGAASEAVIDPVANAIKTVSDDYRKNLEHHTQSAFESAEQARKDAAGERGWQGRLLSPFQTSLAAINTAFAPISAAATSVGHGATYLTGNPAFGQRAEFLANFIDPSHVGLAKVGAMKLGKVAEDLAPYSAMFVPVAKADPALATAKQMLAEGKAADEIKSATGIHFGPESHFGSYELKSNVPDEFGRYPREGEMPLNPESRPMKEISDEGLILNRDPSNDIPLSQNQAIESYTFEHPELAKQFPELAGAYQDVKVHPNFGPEGAFYAHTEIAPGQWGPKLEVRAPSVEEARSVAAHELQHFVAEKGGLEQGADPLDQNLIDFHSHIFKEAKNEIATVQNERAAFAEAAAEEYKNYYNIDPNSTMGSFELNHVRHEAENQWLQDLKKTDPERVKELERAMYIQQRVDTPYKMYQHMYGEALARATQDRLNIPKENRDHTPLEFNYNQYQGKGQPDILTPIPEGNLFSNKDYSDFRDANSGFVYSSPEPTVAKSALPPKESEGVNLTRRSFLQGTAAAAASPAAFAKGIISEISPAGLSLKNITKAINTTAVSPEAFRLNIESFLKKNDEKLTRMLIEDKRLELEKQTANPSSFNKGKSREQLETEMKADLESNIEYHAQEREEAIAAVDEYLKSRGNKNLSPNDISNLRAEIEKSGNGGLLSEETDIILSDYEKAMRQNIVKHFEKETNTKLSKEDKNKLFSDHGQLYEDWISGQSPSLPAPSSIEKKTTVTSPLEKKLKLTAREQANVDAWANHYIGGSSPQKLSFQDLRTIEAMSENARNKIDFSKFQLPDLPKEASPQLKKLFDFAMEKAANIAKEKVSNLLTREMPPKTATVEKPAAVPAPKEEPLLLESPKKAEGEKSGGAVDAGRKKSNTVHRAMDISRFGTDAVQSAVNLARQHRGRPDS